MLVNLNDLLYDAQKQHYGVGYFNTIDIDVINGAIAAAEELQAPIIIGTAEALLPYGELKLMAPLLLTAARNASVPVAVHLDHGFTFERCVEALQCGFTSIMFDGSTSDISQNIANTRELVRIAHAMGAAVEGEIGHVGSVSNEEGETDGAPNEKHTLINPYTMPDEAEMFLEKTGVDALAIAIGTAHGAYRSKPCLNIERLREIRARVNTPLVLHGGSGLSDSDFKNTVSEGITKVNIFTDLCIAEQQSLADSIAEGLPYLEMRKRKTDAVKEAVKLKLRLFGSDNKA